MRKAVLLPATFAVVVVPLALLKADFSSTKSVCCSLDAPSTHFSCVFWALPWTDARIAARELDHWISRECECASAATRRGQRGRHLYAGRVAPRYTFRGNKLHPRDPELRARLEQA